MVQAKLISVFNQKGGVGKTTTVVNLAASLAKEFGKKVLVVDMDAQANATRCLLDVDIGENEKTVYHSLVSDSSAKLMLKALIRQTSIPNLDIVPSDIFLSEAELELMPKMGRETILKERIGDLNKTYDFIFFDCPPSLGLLSINCLVASTHIIVPIECQFLALKGFQHLAETVALVKEKFNPNLSILGLLPTKFYAVSRSNNEILDFIRKKLKKQFPVFKTIIHRDVQAEESPYHRKPLLMHKPYSRACREYMALAKEILKAK